MQVGQTFTCLGMLTNMAGGQVVQEPVDARVCITHSDPQEVSTDRLCIKPALQVAWRRKRHGTMCASGHGRPLIAMWLTIHVSVGE